MKEKSTDKTSWLDRDISDLWDKMILILRRFGFLIITLPPCVILLIINSPLNYPAENELKFEECTFIKYKYEYYDPLDRSDYEEYLVYVEEYDKPLKITDIVFDKADENALQNLKAGNKVTISFYDHHGTLCLYSMSYGDNYILSYNDYLSESLDNDKSIYVICIFFIILSVALSFVDPIYKKIKGKSLFWREE